MDVTRSDAIALPPSKYLRLFSSGPSNDFCYRLGQNAFSTEVETYTIAVSVIDTACTKLLSGFTPPSSDLYIAWR